MAFGAVKLDPYVQVGGSGLVVYKVGLGTMQFGWSSDEATAFEIMDCYHQAGGNFIDAADCYTSWSDRMGGPVNAGGVSEEIVGRWLASRGNRDEMVIATKVRAAMGVQFGEHRGTIHQREGLSRRWIAKACEDSLRRLNVDHIDLYQAHFIDPLVPIEETLAAFTDLVRRGLVRYIGVSNFSAWRLMQALWAADAGGLESVVSVQPRYNMLSPVRRDFEEEIAQACHHYGVGVFPYSPLGGGLLAGRYGRSSPRPASVRADENQAMLTETNLDIIDAVLDVATRNELPPAAVAMAWTMARPFVTAPIVGANRRDQLQSVLDHVDVELEPVDLRLLDDVSDWPRTRTHLEE